MATPSRAIVLSLSHPSSAQTDVRERWSSSSGDKAGPGACHYQGTKTPPACGSRFGCWCSMVVRWCLREHALGHLWPRCRGCRLHGAWAAPFTRCWPTGGRPAGPGRARGASGPSRTGCGPP
uniref:Putative secreted protein n=1 Tax=Ixodes ricinus TaxID=34613 RepID=A0A6B0UNS7_IXORI